MTSTTRTRKLTARRVRRRGRRRTPVGDVARRIAALGLGLTAVLLLLRPVDSVAAEITVVVAARDLPAGTVLGPDDLDAVAIAPALVPDNAIHSGDLVTGKQTIGGVRRGEILTDKRISGQPAYQVPSGYLPLVVPISDAQTLLTLRDGDCIDVYAGYAGAPLSVLATSAILISISTPSKSAESVPSGAQQRAHVVAGVTQDQVPDLLQGLSAEVIVATLCHA